MQSSARPARAPHCCRVSPAGLSTRHRHRGQSQAQPGAGERIVSCGGHRDGGQSGDQPGPRLGPPSHQRPRHTAGGDQLLQDLRHVEAVLEDGTNSTSLQENRRTVVYCNCGVGTLLFKQNLSRLFSEHSALLLTLAGLLVSSFMSVKSAEDQTGGLRVFLYPLSPLCCSTAAADARLVCLCLLTILRHWTQL